MIKKRVYRQFSDDFKLSVVEEYLTGSFSLSSLCKKYSLCRSVLYCWIRTFAPEYELNPSIMAKKDTESEKIAELKKVLRQKELELKREKMRADFYETMVTVASEQLDIDIRKKVGTKQ